MKNNVFYIDNGISHIKKETIPNQDFERIIIPSSVLSIDPYSLVSDVSYNGTLISREEVKLYGCEYIPRIAFLKEQGVFPFLVEKGIWKQIPLDKDAIKAFQNNYRIYERLQLLTPSKKVKSLYPICHIFGLFSTTGILQNRIFKIIELMYKNISLIELETVFSTLSLQPYDLRFSKIMVDIGSDGHVSDILPYFRRLYEDKNFVLNAVRRHKQEKLSQKNSEYIKANKSQGNVDDLKRELEILKQDCKVITWQDITTFYTTKQLTVRKGNEALEPLIPILLCYLDNQAQFDILQDIYEESMKLSIKQDSLFKSIVEQNEDIHFEWLKGNDVRNLILGYIVNCCAIVGKLGLGILRVSMTNPHVRTMILWENNKIIGKATAYYNPTEKYLLLNTVEMAHFFICSAKTTDQMKKSALEAILRGIEAQHFDAKDIRIGMSHNDLERQIKEQFVITKDLLPNIDYDGYSGDASDVECGQAIISKGRVL